MKLIHAADIHLGSRMDSAYPREISTMRKAEVRNTFSRMADYAVQNGVSAILLAGDVFDSDTPFKRDRDFFYSVVKNHPSVDFLYLKGNHDKGSGYEEEPPANLKTFGGSWTAYPYGDVTVSGIELSGENATSLYSTLSLAPDHLNIVMLHGQIADTAGRDKICLKRLRGKGIDYLALGHVHKPKAGQLDERGEYAYCGCLEGRGFDEPGEHGFLLLDAGEKLTSRFVPFAEREITQLEADISGITNAYDAAMAVKRAVVFEKKNIYRIDLVGEVELDTERLDADVEKYLSGECLFVSVKDRTAKKLDVTAFADDASLKGEFVRTVAAEPTYSEEEKQAVVRCGLRALRGEELDL